MKEPVVYLSGGKELLDQVRPLWEKLNVYHRQHATHFADQFDRLTFDVRKQKFLSDEAITVRVDLVKGKNMTGYIVGEQLDHIFVDGNGQTIYYARDKGNIIGLNRAESSKLAIQFKEGKAFRISFLGNPEGRLTPLPQLSEEERRLSGFDWKERIRPQSRADIFRKTETSAALRPVPQEEAGPGPLSTPEEEK